MRSLLTYYDKKLHLKTVWNEGYEAAQKEIDELKSTLQDKIAEIANKDAEIAKVDAEIEELNRQLAEAKK
ncbi:MAG: hypothetical protein SPF36_06400 [Lachnospiraceae bacterium]|nr:hypothetical protein [Lachnospiraceae bacterium]